MIVIGSMISLAYYLRILAAMWMQDPVVAGGREASPALAAARPALGGAAAAEGGEAAAARAGEPAPTPRRPRAAPAGRSRRSPPSWASA